MLENRIESLSYKKTRFTIGLYSFYEFKELNVGDISLADISFIIDGIRLEMDEDGNEYKIFTLQVNSLKLDEKNPIRK